MKASIFAGLIALAAAGFAQTPSDAPAVPTVLLSPSTAISASTMAPDDAIFASNRRITPKAGCSAQCGPVMIMCLGSPCSGEDRNCALGERGYVTCAGVTTLCPSPCP